MKKHLLLAAIALQSMMTMSAQDITLPAPQIDQPSKTVVEALNTRRSVRAYTAQELTAQQLSICAGLHVARMRTVASPLQQL